MQNIIKVIAILFFLPVIALANQDDSQFAGGRHDGNSMEGYFGLGLDASPFINFLGNVANNTADNSLDFSDNTLYFRYFITDNAAIRLNFNIYSYKNSVTHFIRDDNAYINNPLSNKQVEDRRTEFINDYTVRAGYQYFFNAKSRLRGFAGADVGYGYSKEYFVYEYGNVMNEFNPRPTTITDWNAGTSGPMSNRRIENVDKLTHTILAGVFTGLESVFMDVFVIGLEVGVLYGMGIPGKQFEVQETMSGSIHLEQTLVTGRDHRTRMIQSTKPYSYGNIYLFFHF